MLGMVVPGMPNTAAELAEQFGSVTGDFDGVTWAKYLAAMYSLAYFETDIETIVDEAAGVMPENSWPYTIYEECKTLYAQDSTDWAWAVTEIENDIRNVHESNNVQTLTDINNGITIIALLYGDGDWEDTCKIASVAGYDGDCNAATATGIVGIMVGTSGLPQEVNDVIYLDGDGVYIDDVETGFDPYIKLNYPSAQSFDDIAALFVSNGEDQIVAHGGSIGVSSYTIELEDVIAPDYVIIDNYDFEEGDLTSWSTDIANTSYVYADQSSESHSGAYRGRIDVDQTVTNGKLYVELSNLEAGATYKVNAYLICDEGQTARLYAENYGGGYIHSDIDSKDDYWVHKTIQFTLGSSNTTAEVGLHLPDNGDGDSYGCIDNLFVEKISSSTYQRYEAENATRSGGQVSSETSASNSQYIGGLDGDNDYLSFAVSVSATGEYYMRVNYANGYDYMSSHDLYVNSNYVASVFYPTTGSWGEFFSEYYRSTYRISIRK